MGGRTMRRFWDARAREDPFFFVHNRIPYGAGDVDAFWRSGEEELDRMLTELGLAIEPDQDVLEIGCGVGRITRQLAARARTVLALDVSAEMLRRASELNPELTNVTWLEGDGRSLAGVGDESVDVCQSYVVFQHIPDPEITLGYVREIGRVLRPGGRAAIQFSNAPPLHRKPPLRLRLRRWWRAVRGEGPRGQTHRAWLGSYVELSALREAAQEVGMQVERVSGEGTIACFALLRK